MLPFRETQLFFSIVFVHIARDLHDARAFQRRRHHTIRELLGKPLAATFSGLTHNAGLTQKTVETRQSVPNSASPQSKQRFAFLYCDSLPSERLYYKSPVHPTLACHSNKYKGKIRTTSRNKGVSRMQAVAGGGHRQQPTKTPRMWETSLSQNVRKIARILRPR